MHLAELSLVLALTVGPLCEAYPHFFLSSQPLAIDLLNPSAETEAQRHKFKRLVQCVPLRFLLDLTSAEQLSCLQIAQQLLHGCQMRESDGIDNIHLS